VKFRVDDLILTVQHLIDRVVRRIRLGPPPHRNRRRLLIVQIDGLSLSVLERGLSERRMPFISRLLKRHHYRIEPMSVGLPTSTPAFQMAAMYGVQPDIPAFHYHHKRRRSDIYFPRAGDAARVEEAHAKSRLGILRGGSSYGCVFTGGADNNLFSFAMFKTPTGKGVLRALSAFIVLGWVLIKGLFSSLLELGRALLRLIADPFGGGWKWLMIKLGISVWLRQLFTLAVSRDLYRGVPVIYVNYLDYDVFAHAFGPQHPRAMRALRRVDRSIHQLWRVCRRVPEHQYDLYILSDHGQAPCTPYKRLTKGKRLEQLLFDEFIDPARVRDQEPSFQKSARFVSGLKSYRQSRAPGMFQRFVNYLESDFPWVLGEFPEARERAGVRVISAGPNALVYFLEREEPVTIEWIDERFPELAEEISRSPGIGFVLARSSEGPVCVWRGKRYRVGHGEAGPFARRDDLTVVMRGIQELMEMPSAGDLVIYGIGAPEGHVSFINERGAHAGPSPDELKTFIIVPRHITLPSPITHPIQLYGHFVAYQEAA
jgi:hypothetical protein